MRIACGKEANNAELIQEICKGSRGILPSLSISKIRWLHAPKEQEARRLAGKTRGTVVISLPTQAIQHEVVRRGLVIQHQHFEATLHNHAARSRQCFNCSQWGHTQSACSKKAQCGYCAGPHQTKECPKSRVSCVNCGQAHRAWQKKSCKTYHAYLQTLHERQAALLSETNALRRGSAGSAQGPQVAPPMAFSAGEGYTVVQGKRRKVEPSTPAKRGVGRPTYLATAGLQLGQTRLEPVVVSSQSAPAERVEIIGTPQSSASSEATRVGTPIEALNTMDES